MFPQDIPAVALVITTLDAEAAKLEPESPLAEMFSDWASLLRGELLPWQLPWDIAAILSQA